MTYAKIIRDFQSDTQLGDLFFLDAKSAENTAMYNLHQSWQLTHPAIHSELSKPVFLKLRFVDAVEHVDRQIDMMPMQKDETLLGYATSALMYQHMLEYGTSGLHGLHESDRHDERVKKFGANLDAIIAITEIRMPEEVADVRDSVKNSFKQQFLSRLKVA